jgi:lipid-A-disaccharide synthase
MSRPRIFLSAGEASGEHYGALLIAALRTLAPDAEFFGMGGQRMEDRGLRRIVRAEDVAVMGITEVIRHLPRIYGEYRKLKQSILSTPPDIAILIDFPDIHFRLARHLHEHGIPVIFFVSPQLWAWKKHRIRLVQQYVDRMLVIFPFEEPFYQKHGVTATYVGHPLADLPLPSISRTEFARQYDLDSSKDWVGLLPGSRAKEIQLNLPEMLQAAKESGEDCEFLLPIAPTLTEEAVRNLRAMLADSAKGLRVTLVNDARAALYHARASVVASGTATVEAALIGNPFLVVYRVSSLTYAIARRVVTVPFVAMVNLVADRGVVPELIQDDFSAANVAKHLRVLLHDETRRQQMIADLTQVANKLGRTPESHQTAIERVAGITMQLIQQNHNDLLMSPAR